MRDVTDNVTGELAPGRSGELVSLRGRTLMHPVLSALVCFGFLALCAAAALRIAGYSWGLF
ncbi:hypothetical protein RaPhPE226_gp8 [Ralstonia phage PE226]|uniref:Uncharacterized protein n=1 Tax=Ralstonia phage PE226 TaxID=926543 RepID=E5F075_9VIRU|nr:hypothetical protein RaPhPE226_gp8 [Ralstonia phage PE226]ADQ27593.1 unknown [Ralstonia phage PE226]